MDVVDIIRNSNSVPEILAALSIDAESLRNIEAVPDWCISPLRDVADIHERVPILLGLLHRASQQLRDRDCDAAKRALRGFAAALHHLR